MTKKTLKEALEELLSEYPDGTSSTVQKLTAQDKKDLIAFCEMTATTWFKHPPTTDEISSFLHGFILGHEWVRTRWTLW
jgi:hypothetical protein